MTNPYRSWVEISRGAIAANYNAVVEAMAGSAEVMPVVKADAYRHGAVEVSRVLEGVGARWLAVSNVEEGVALRQAGIEARILVMADFLPFGRQAALEHDLTPVLHCPEDIAVFDRLAAEFGKPARYHLKVDSGMCRLGTRAPASSIVDAVNGASTAVLEGLMTHFASPSDFDSLQTDEQIREFDSLRQCLMEAGLRPAYVHIASTNAIAYGRAREWTNLVRPGHAIYGYVSPAKGPGPPSRLTVTPVLTWKARLLAVKDIPAGALVGYGGIYKAPRPMRIGVLAAGYADGIPHRLSNRGRVIAGGKFAAVLGAVSMDVTTIDLSEAPALAVGDAVTLLGSEGELSQDAQQMARAAGTISYSLLCGISSRVKRVYVR